jgi:pilus assembly protein Flp/PilA
MGSIWCIGRLPAGRLSAENASRQHFPRATSRTAPMIMTLWQRDEEGQGLAEYALILALIAVIAIGALMFLGGQISTILSSIGVAV